MSAKERVGHDGGCIISRIKPLRLTVEEFQENKKFAEKLFSPLNQWFNELYLSLLNKLTVEDNLFQEIKEIDFKNTSNNYPYKFRTKFNSTPKGLVSIYLFNKTLGAYSTETPLMVWDYANQEITVSTISGLTLESSYVLRVLIVYG